MPRRQRTIGSGLAVLLGCFAFAAFQLCQGCWTLVITWHPRLPRNSASVTLYAEGQASSWQDLKVGQELLGRRTNSRRDDELARPGVYIDLGFEKLAYLPTDEWCDGVPLPAKTDLNELITDLGAQIRVRVLKIENGEVFVTCRTGDLERPPPFEHVQIGAQDLAYFAVLGPGDWLDAEVIGLTTYGAWVKVQPPGGRDVQGLILKSGMSNKFKERAHLGMGIRVRMVDEGEWDGATQVILSMRAL